MDFSGSRILLAEDIESNRYIVMEELMKVLASYLHNANEDA